MASPAKENRKPNDDKRLVQSVIQIGKSSGSTSEKCPDCLMTYSPVAARDLVAHERFHNLHINGRKWSMNWGDLVEKFPLARVKGASISINGGLTPKNYHQRAHSRIITSFKQDRIVVISKTKASEVRATLEIMHIVNDELNAPHNENYIWSGIPDDDEHRERIASRSPSWRPDGLAFVYVSDGRAVGIVIVEHLKHEDQRGRWMVCGSNCIVPGVRPFFKMGISRIWVSRRHRGCGIATRLLDSARKHTIPGTEVAKWELAWSQPSESGGKLAESYNTIVHKKSGKKLLPCYV